MERFGAFGTLTLRLRCDLLTEFVRLESRCCPFLRFSLTVDPAAGAAWLELTGPPGTREFLESETERASG